MSRRMNEKFMAAYIELDGLCQSKFGLREGGVTEYINRLNNARIAPRREEALPKLVRYRTIRNMIAHEVGAARRDNGITGKDISWIRRFSRNIRHKKDPVSIYLRRARLYLRFRRLRKIALLAGCVLLVALIITLLIVLL